MRGKKLNDNDKSNQNYILPFRWLYHTFSTIHPGSCIDDFIARNVTVYRVPGRNRLSEIICTT